MGCEYALGNVESDTRTWHIETLAFSSDGTTLTGSTDDFVVKLWEVATGRELVTLRAMKSS